MTATPDRGMWVWDTKPLLRDAAERRTFFDFCKQFRITVVAMQIATGGTDASRQLDNDAEWKALLTEAHRRNMTVHALDGDPSYARRWEHDTALSIVESVISYNKAVVHTARFDGVHLDIEPYLLPEWKDPTARERLLAEYLEFNRAAAMRAHAAALLYGVDIPFWWHAPDETTGQPFGLTTFRGERKLATDHLLGFVDNIGIMAYRNIAAGPDGIITLALDSILRADKSGKKVSAFVGVETEKVGEGVPAKITFAGKSPNELKTQVLAAEAALSRYSSFAGIAIHPYEAFRKLVKAP